jgi:hypothetical protein
MKIKMHCFDDDSELKYQLSTCDIDNPQYLVMNNITFAKFFEDYYYQNIPIAICDSLKLGEIDIV